jgi:hypothetical protein
MKANPCTVNRLSKALAFVAVLVAAGFVFPANAALINHYTFDSNVNDSAGTRNGTINGNASISTTVFAPGGSTGSLDLTSGGSVALPGGGGSLADFTIAMWIKINGGPDGGISSLFSTDDWNTSAIHLNYQTMDGNDVIHNAGGAGISQVSNTVFPAPSGWVHLAITAQLDPGVQILQRMFMNGAEDAPLASTGLGTNVLEAVTVGQWNEGRQFNGYIDDLRIYNSALSQGEILALVPEPGTFGLLASVLVALAIRRRRCIG